MPQGSKEKVSFASRRTFSSARERDRMGSSFCTFGIRVYQGRPRSKYLARHFLPFSVVEIGEEREKLMDVILFTLFLNLAREKGSPE